MHIVYDHQTFSLQARGGISRYFCELVTSLGSFPDCTTTVLAFAHQNDYLERARFPYVGTRVPITGRVMRARIALNEALTTRWLRQHSPDVVHQTYYFGERRGQQHIPIVVTVHDMIHERFPTYFEGDDTARRKAKAVRRADAVICISNSTRNDLLQYSDIDPAKVHVVYHGCTTLGTPGRTQPRIAPPYLLYVGHRRGYKNWDALLAAIGSSALLRSSFTLVCCGGPPLSDRENALIRKLLPRERPMVHVTCDDASLASLYEHAAAHVCPSLYEGFGMTPLEAMAHNCPVVCSDAGSLPEIVDGAAEMFDPYDPGAIARAIESVVLSPTRSAELRDAGMKRVREFTWDECARKTRAVYERIAPAKNR